MDEAEVGEVLVFDGGIWSMVSLPLPLSVSLPLPLLVVDEDASA